MKARKPHAGVPTLIDGKLYPSITAAARALNLSYQSVANAMNRGDFSGLGKGTWRTHANIVEHKGKKYDSSGIFAREFKLCPKDTTNRLSRAKKRGSDTFMTDVGEVKIIGRLKDIEKLNH